MTTPYTSDVVLDVAPEDQVEYARNAYHDYLNAWNEAVQALEAARRAGDVDEARRLADELRHVWPQPEDVADAAWIAPRDREEPLPSDGVR